MKLSLHMSLFFVTTDKGEPTTYVVSIVSQKRGICTSRIYADGKLLANINYFGHFNDALRATRKFIESHADQMPPQGG